MTLTAPRKPPRFRGARFSFKRRPISFKLWPTMRQASQAITGRAITSRAITGQAFTAA
ncbi:MAG: hypothetical protein GY904_32080 [Planctomycetaceae bacterium]|nr:hypothetical protein [Planctomycetaceae bacterium]